MIQQQTVCQTTWHVGTTWHVSISQVKKDPAFAEYYAGLHSIGFELPTQDEMEKMDAEFKKQWLDDQYQRKNRKRFGDPGNEEFDVLRGLG